MEAALTAVIGVAGAKAAWRNMLPKGLSDVARRDTARIKDAMIEVLGFRVGLVALRLPVGDDFVVG